MTETYDKLNHWYGWNGGECPIHPKTVIDGIERGIYWECALAKELDWPSFRGAFRIIKLHADPKVISASSNGTEAMRRALKYYENTFCEGFCKDFPAGYTDEHCEGDCSGCKARAALSTHTEEPKT